MKNMIISVAAIILAITLMSLQAIMSKTIIKKIVLMEAAKDCTILIDQSKVYDRDKFMDDAKILLEEKKISYSDFSIEDEMIDKNICIKICIYSDDVYGKYMIERIVD